MQFVEKIVEVPEVRIQEVRANCGARGSISLQPLLVVYNVMFSFRSAGVSQIQKTTSTRSLGVVDKKPL